MASELDPVELTLISAELRETVDLLRRGLAQVRVRDRDGTFALADQLAKMAARLEELQEEKLRGKEPVALRGSTRRGTMPRGALSRRKPPRWRPSK